MNYRVSKSKNKIFNTAWISLAVFGIFVLSACSTEKPEGVSEMSMKDEKSAEYTTQTASTQAQITPEEAVSMLKDGNARFRDGRMIQRDLISQVEQTASGQYPFAAVVSCIDSRIPTEIVFDQGIGDIFNARVAGNFVDAEILGSLEFAAKVAGAKAIVVLGHTHCGAIKGVCDGVKLGNLTTLLAKLEPALDSVTDVTENRNSKNADFVQKVADAHVELTVEKIKADSPVLREMYENGEVGIVGAMYDVESGIVRFTD
jgi:carbonic anhydrase